MKKLRKTLCAGMAALMIAGSLAGCGSSGELETLKTENAQLQESLTQITNDMEYLESSAHDASAALAAAESELANVDNKLTAFSLLVAAQNAYIDFDREEVEQALAELEPYIGYLEGEDLTAYYMILEYMEQPYNGTDTQP